MTDFIRRSIDQKYGVYFVEYQHPDQETIIMHYVTSSSHYCVTVKVHCCYLINIQHTH